MEVWETGEAFEEAFEELLVHPGDGEIESDRFEGEGFSEEFVPFFVPVGELLQSFPLVFVVADELGFHHDVVPVVVNLD